MWETRVRSLGWEDPPEKEMAIHSILLPGKSHGHRSLVGYSPWGHKEMDMTEQLHFHLNLYLVPDDLIVWILELQLFIINKNIISYSRCEQIYECVLEQWGILLKHNGIILSGSRSISGFSTFSTVITANLIVLLKTEDFKSWASTDRLASLSFLSLVNSLVLIRYTRSTT